MPAEALNRTSAARSTDFQSAVSPIYNRQGVALTSVARCLTASRLACVVLVAFCGYGAENNAKSARLTGELRKWEPLALTFDGPETSEEAQPNPFTDYRLEVT